MERWSDILGHPRYEVSDVGRVKNKETGRVLRPGRQSSGHVSVVLGRGNTRTVHSLVAEAFCGPRRPGFEVRHLDGDPSNNRLTNLAWGTRGENNRDKKYHAGQKNRMTLQAARAAKADLLAGFPQRAVAAKFGISKSAAYAISAGKFHTDV